MRIATLVTNYFEDAELTEPMKALKEAGHEVIVISPKREEIHGKKGQARLMPDRTIDEVRPDDFDALFVPGGFSPDQLRADPKFVDFTRHFDAARKPIFAICHGPQLLFTADVLDNHRTTAWKTVQTDLLRAGVDVLDQEVVEDGNLVTSRQPSDIPAFNEAMVGLLDRRQRAEGDVTAQPLFESAPSMLH